MISVKEASKILKKALPPDFEVGPCFKYKNAYLFAASNVDEDYNDPYYLFDPKTGEIENFIIDLSDKAFFKALSNPITK